MSFNLLRRGEPQRVQTGVVSANYFDALGVRPLFGRTFREGEDQAGATPVVVLSYRFWRERLGGDTTIIGKTVEMTDRLHTVIGILPPLPAFPNENDVFMPVSSCPFRTSEFWVTRRDVRALTVFAVARPGVELAAVRGDLKAVASQMHNEHAESYPRRAGLRDRCGVAARGAVRSRSGDAGAAARDVRVRPGHCLRERGEPDARATRAPARGARRARGAGGRHGPARAPAADGERRRGGGRSAGGRRARGCPAPGPGPVRGAVHAARVRDRSRRPRAALHARRIGRRGSRIGNAAARCGDSRSRERPPRSRRWRPGARAPRPRRARAGRGDRLPCRWSSSRPPACRSAA